VYRRQRRGLFGSEKFLLHRRVRLRLVEIVESQSRLVYVFGRLIGRLVVEGKSLCIVFRRDFHLRLRSLVRRGLSLVTVGEKAYLRSSRFHRRFRRLIL